MSEKRFTYANLLEVEMIYDQETERGYYFNSENCTTNDVKDLIQLLNEQQATITHLEKVNGKNFAKRRLLEQDNLVLRNENEQLRQQLSNYELAKRNLIKRLDDREKEDFERFFK